MKIKLFTTTSKNDSLRFLLDLLDPELDLLPEYSGAKDYWLFHDNYLAAKVLREPHPDISQRITRAMKAFGGERSGKIEILFDEAATPLPFHLPELTTVKTIGDKQIRTEVLTDKIAAGWENYADLLFFATLAERTNDPKIAAVHFHQALSMWDGKGFMDAATRAMQVYAAYKLALALIVSKKLNQPLPMDKIIWTQLQSLRHTSGGFITDYDRDGKPNGVPNVETTSIIIHAISIHE